MTSMRFLLLLLAVGPTALAAQQPPDARWLPWLGCWQVSEMAEPGAPLVCVRPASDPLGVEVAMVTERETAVSRALIADGRRHDVTLDDCKGSQVASFSGDGRRVYLRSTFTCQGGQRRTASGIMAMASPTMWLDARSIGVDDELVPQVLHYYPAPPASWPDEFLLSTERADSVIAARVRAAGPMTLADVEEAATQVDGDALATFLLERHQRFDLTAAGLAALDDAAVPDAVIDALVAVSYPGRFAVVREETRPVHRSVTPPALAGETYRTPYGWGWWGYGQCAFATYCDSYGYGGENLYYRSRYARAYQTLVYGPSFSSGYGGRPVIIDRTVRRPGMAVGGRGYTRGGAPGGSGSYARPRTGSVGGVGSPGYSSSGSQGGTGGATSGGYSRSGGSSSSGSSSGTAKTRHRH